MPRLTLGPLDPLQEYAKRQIMDLSAPDADAHVELVETARLLCRRVLVLEQLLTDAGIQFDRVIE